MNSTLTNSTVLEFNDGISVFIMILMSTLSIQFLLGLSLNCYTIFILSRAGRIDLSNVFLINCAVAEILFSISSLLFVTMLNQLYSNVWIYFLFVTSMSARLLFLCCVCLKHYVAVLYPVTFLKLKPLRYRVACSVLAWICALLLGAVGYILNCPHELLAVVFLIILAGEFFCCVSILRRLRASGPMDRRSDTDEMNAAKKKAFQTVSINLLLCIVQNIPIIASYGLVHFLSPTSPLVFNKADVISTIVNITAGFVQPLFILHKFGKLPFIQCP